MGDLLKSHDLTPDLIISSDAKRAATTAKLVALACDYEQAIIHTPDFYLAAPETYLETLQTLDDIINTVMIVGHNPGMEMLVAELTDAHEPFTTANIAHVRLAINSWRDLADTAEGELLDLWRPKEI
jgi:phosphohistidine phosphatase